MRERVELTAGAFGPGFSSLFFLSLSRPATVHSTVVEPRPVSAAEFECSCAASVFKARASEWERQSEKTHTNTQTKSHSLFLRPAFCSRVSFERTLLAVFTFALHARSFASPPFFVYFVYFYRSNFECSYVKTLYWPTRTTSRWLVVLTLPSTSD